LGKTVPGRGRGEPVPGGSQRSLKNTQIGLTVPRKKSGGRRQSLDLCAIPSASVVEATSMTRAIKGEGEPDCQSVKTEGIGQLTARPA